MTIDWTAVGSVGSALAVVVAVVALIRESRASRFVVGVEMIMRLNDQFESSAMRESRRRAATYLKDPKAKAAEAAHVKDVLNFFSMVALLESRGALDARTVWFTFAYYLLPFFRRAGPVIAEVRKREPLSYKTLEALYESVRDIEKDERGFQLALPDQAPSDAAFLDEESTLT